jgi:hypothetical protein
LEDLVREVKPEAFKVQTVGEFELTRRHRPVTVYEALPDGHHPLE